MRYLALLLLIPSLAFAQSRDFDGSTDYLENTTWGGSTAVALAMAGWFYLDGDSNSTNTMVGINDTGSTNQYFEIDIAMGDADEALRCVTRAGGFLAAEDADTASDQWVFGGCAHWGLSDRRVYTNFTETTNGSTSSAPSGLDAVSVGNSNVSGNARWFDGKIAMVAIWTGIQGIRPMAELEAGMWPEWVRTDQLDAFWTFWADGTGEPDISGNGEDLSEQGTPARHSLGPPVFFPE